MSSFSHYNINYAGFWRRLTAFLLDSMLIGLVTTGLAAYILGVDQLLQMKNLTVSSDIDWNLLLLDQLPPAIITITFWLAWKATPGKLLFDCQILDADTFERASFSQLLLRYLCYLVSALPLGLGFVWIVFNKRNQGWHDKLSNTVVIMQDESLNKLESYV